MKQNTINPLDLLMSNKEDQFIISEKIKLKIKISERIKEMQINKKQAAKEAMISQPRMSDVLNNISGVSIEMLYRVALRLGVDL